MFAKRVADTPWSEEKLTLLCRAAESESNKLGLPICLAVVDDAGNLVYFYRQPGALLVSIGIAQNKAYTSAVMRMSTGELAKLTVPGESLFGINTAAPRLAIFGGGFPLLLEGNLVGAIGISGGSVEEDEQIGRAVLEAFNSIM